MSPTDKQPSRIRTSQDGVEETHRQRRSVCFGVWGTKMPVVILPTAPIVQRLRETAAALSEERVPMQTLAQAHGPAAPCC